MERRVEKNVGVIVMLAALCAALILLGLMIGAVYAEKEEKPSDRAILVYSDKEAQTWSRDA